ncbi:MAG: sigma 54-interacting transcriptional regulator [Myxococcota bacterium]|jgi:transcriptional regulator with GAF, ATPase, and Fis domain|nr:sigma 54-interacting transcriptional regulator [Myxococcota bacterium]
MATLTIRSMSGSRETYGIVKSVTTIGSSSSCDIRIDAQGLADCHAQIIFDGRDFNVAESDINANLLVNGKPKRKARLAHDDRMELGDIEMVFSVFASPSPKEREQGGQGELEGLRKLQAFSAKLMAATSLSTLLDELMDAMIGLTGATKGFLVLFEGEAPVVKVARNIHKENVDTAVAQLSDSIIAKVVETRAPVIVSDALNDSTFGTAESVINLRLSSVMCLPLMDRGRLLGLVYLGNDRAVALFDASALDFVVVLTAQASLIVASALLLDELKLRAQSLTQTLDKQRFGEIIGSSPAMQVVFKQVEKVAGADVSVLIGGETGTGKELIAREIHRRSNRAGREFVSVNCGAIPESLMESEFFGHMRGAFTGAVATRDGKFQAADKGTIFLDEIGEMPLSLQVKLLRVLQERQVVKVGSTKAEFVDIRVLAATNRDLTREIAEGRFREDLYYRLNVVRIELPPLKDREEDIIILAKYLLQRYAEEYRSKVRGFTPNAIGAVRRHAWPGNVRELENRLKKAVILCDGTMIGPKDLDLSEDALPEIVPLAEAKENFQRQYILDILSRNNGNRTKTARDLDVDPRTIFRYLEKA